VTQVLRVSRRSLSYVEDDDAFQRGRHVGKGLYEFAPDDRARVLGILGSWACTLASEANADRETRADVRAIRADLERNG
jgi:hypothetical protein